jgi:hypothetical protein
VCEVAAAVHRDALLPQATNYLLQHSAGSGKSLTIAAMVATLLRMVSNTTTVYCFLLVFLGLGHSLLAFHKHFYLFQE